MVTILSIIDTVPITFHDKINYCSVQHSRMYPSFRSLKLICRLKCPIIRIIYQITKEQPKIRLVGV